MNKFEFRLGSPAEIRQEGDAIKVSGYAAVFNEEANIGNYFREIIRPGAFREAIKNDDVVFVINHQGLPLARTRSGTLTLKEDKTGLFMSTDLEADDPDVRSIVPKMKRGDLDKMSFAFYVDDDGQRWIEEKDKIPLRVIERFSAIDDVSIVTRPAYDGTSIGMRSHEHALKDLEYFKKKQKADHYARRLRMRGELALRERINA